MIKRVKLGYVRRLIRETLGAAASGTDPKDAEGFYPYEIERGADIHSFWYRSPARSMGSDGDPGRPADAAEYNGMKPPPDNSNEEGESTGGDATAETAPETTSEPTDDENLA